VRVDPVSMLGRILSWYGLLGAPIAWTVLHVSGVGIATAACSTFGSANDIPVQPWSLALSVGCAAVAVGALLSAVVVWWSTRGVDDSEPPPVGRIHFLAVIGLVIAPLFIAIILMSGIAGTTLGCTQG
jgi:hypothetical protein